MTATTTQRRADNVVATLFPGYFALVMATGIIAIGADQQELGWVAEPLFAIAIVAYVVLGALLVARLVRYPRQLAADLTSHAKGFAFLTVVAATNVLGSAAIVLHDWRGVAWVLWYASLALWAVLAYTPLIAVVLRSPKPGLGAGINGSWFLLTVSTESIAVLGALLLARSGSDALAFVCLAAFTLGLVLYLIVMTMVFLRWTFQALEPTEADPPAWIAAGAVAITVLAGSNLLLARDSSARIGRVAAVRRGDRGVGVGDGDVLVPSDGGHRHLAAHRAKGAAALPPVVLGDGLPTRDVRRRHLPHAARHRSCSVSSGSRRSSSASPWRCGVSPSPASPTTSRGPPAIAATSHGFSRLRRSSRLAERSATALRDPSSARWPADRRRRGRTSGRAATDGGPARR